MATIYNKRVLKPARRWLRNSPTAAEAVLWRSLKRSQLGGKKFRRQHSIGNHIVDFYCPECRLVVELDGQVHFNSIASERDYRRSRALEGMDIRVLRFENRAVFENLPGVLRMISEHLKADTTP
jgi:very-short-patch-repair endonuclease